MNLTKYLIIFFMSGLMMIFVNCGSQNFQAPVFSEGLSRNFPAEINTEGLAKYTQHCSSCHGLFNDSSKRGRTADEIKKAMQTQSEMRHLPSILSDEDVANIADALRINSSQSQGNGDATLLTNGGLEDNKALTGIVRLTPKQYKVTVKQLLGVDVDIDDFRRDPTSEHLDNDSASLYVDDSVLEYFSKTANAIAADTDFDVRALFKCDNSDNLAANLKCLNASLHDILLNLFRRPTSSAEKAIYLSVYQSGYESNGHSFGLRMTLQSILLSPKFLYMTQIGEGGSNLTAYELASKLSYYLTNGPPDKTLLGLAHSNQLLDPKVILIQAKRLMAQKGFESGMINFIFQWLGIDKQAIEPKRHKLFDTANRGRLQAAMITEVESMIKDVMKNESSLDALLTRDYTFANKALSDIYASAPSTENFEKISLAVTERQGIVSLPLVLASHSKEGEEPSPIQRGIMIREHLFCQKFPPAFGSPTAILPEDPTGRLTYQERFDELAKVQGCRECHVYLNVGFSLERYDNLGLKLSGNPYQIEYSGSLNGTQMIGKLSDPPRDSNAFSNTRGFFKELAQSPAIYQCFARQMIRYAQQRVEKLADQNEIKALIEQFQNHQGKIEELVLGIVSSQMFRRVNK